LSSIRQAAVPALAAIGGLAVPALIFTWVNWGDEEALRGWAIPTATDIAFALGVLALLGSRVPVSLKIFLTAVAIIDDLAAIVIIAVFYTAELSLAALGYAAVGIAILAVLNWRGVTRLGAYICIGIFIWIAVLKSGVHATLAGVVIAMAIPLRASDERGESPLRHLEHILHPWAAFAILPLFAFANAGVSFAGMRFTDLLEPFPLGIVLGLFVGKQVGVFVAWWLAIAIGLGERPEGATWTSIYGVSVLTGIGFTMSLFIGTLAFESPEAYEVPLRLGVLAGSLLSGVVGYLLVRAGTNMAEPGSASASKEEVT
ncbi:MAG: Na+/H+ antiporter NhaA, partial [Gammaproteobacteria bacterium]|nr:Na+/H+ antiporter NhaA [Gammaproteobacteria bacterium]